MVEKQAIQGGRNIVVQSLSLLPVGGGICSDVASFSLQYRIKLQKYQVTC